MMRGRAAQKNRIKIGTVLLCLCLFWGMAVSAEASGADDVYELPETETEIFENPRYPAEEAVLLPPEEDEESAPEESASENRAPKLFAAVSDRLTSKDEAVQMLREQMKNRQEQFTISLRLEDPDLAQESSRKNLSKELFERALSHTGDGQEGDYLAWHYSRWKAEVEGTYYKTRGYYDLNLKYTISYYTTKEQEDALTADLAAVEQSLETEGKTDVEIVRAVYDYICSNVRYDYDHLSDDSYVLKHTAYAALENHTAVCQGYALLFYRMALDLGADNRLVSGYVSLTDRHGWNLVKIGDAWYYVDATWDAGKQEYLYFLKGSASFLQSHRLAEGEDELASTSSLLVAQYPVSETDYTELQGTPDDSEESIYGTGIYSVDGVQVYYENGVRQTTTDVKKIGGIWYNLVEGVVTPDTVARNSNGWWYINAEGVVDFGYDGFAQNSNGWWYCEKGRVTFRRNDVIQGTVGGRSGWWLVRRSMVTRKSTIAQNSNGWWYTDPEGRVDFSANTVAKNENGWWAVQNGKVNFRYDGFAQNSNGWWYCEKGKVTFHRNDVIQGTVGGRSGWWLVRGSMVTRKSTVAQNSNGWWYTDPDGRVDFGFDGIASNENGSWYLQRGRVSFGYSGTVRFQNKTWRIVRGKVV